LHDQTPDIARFLTALRRQEPDRVPLSEFLVEPPVKQAFLGRPVGNSLLGTDDYDVAADVEFWAAAGYDYIHLAPWYLHLFPEGWHVARDTYSAYSPGPVEKAWMEEHRGVIASRQDLERYPWPDLGQVQYDHIARARELLPEGMGLTTGTWGILETSRQLMGFEGMCLALYDDPGLVEGVIERVGGFLFQVFQRAAALPGVAALWLADDLAHAQGFFMSPEFYRRVLFPWFKRYGEVAASRGLPLIYHCDGLIWEVIPDLVACGISALQPIEPKAMDIVEVKRRWGQHLALIGNIDLGYTLTLGTPQEVEAEVKQRIREVGPGGGYCVGSSNSVAGYVPLANYRAMIEATLRWGAYPIQV
jgi:uroporphyrinogen decarboxylase